MEDLDELRVAKIIFANGGTELLHSREIVSQHEEEEGKVITEQPSASSNAGNGVRYHSESEIHIKNDDVVSDIKLNTTMMQKKLKWIMSNRLSAKNSRIKKAKYYADLENTVKVLKAKVSTLHPQIEHEKQELLRLKVENSNMLQRLSTYEVMASLKDAQTEMTRAEIKKLKEVLMTGNYHELEQQEEQMDLGYDYSGLNEITTERFYLENGPQWLAETNITPMGVVDLMPSFSPSVANLNLDGLDLMQDSSPTTIARANNYPSN